MKRTGAIIAIPYIIPYVIGRMIKVVKYSYGYLVIHTGLAAPKKKRRGGSRPRADGTVFTSPAGHSTQPLKNLCSAVRLSLFSSRKANSYSARQKAQATLQPRRVRALAAACDKHSSNTTTTLPTGSASIQCTCYNLQVCSSSASSRCLSAWTPSTAC